MAHGRSAFRGSGPGDDQSAMLVSASVREYDVSAESALTLSLRDNGYGPLVEDFDDRHPVPNVET